MTNSRYYKFTGQLASINVRGSDLSGADACKQVALSTDMIVGFCGETEEEHQCTLDLLERTAYEQAFMFAYSQRDRTLAARHLQVLASLTSWFECYELPLGDGIHSDFSCVAAKFSADNACM